MVCIYFKASNLLDIITYENINIWSGNKKHCVFILHWPSVLVYVTTWFTTSINIWGIIMNKSTPILWRHAYQHGIYKFQSELKMKVVTRFCHLPGLQKKVLSCMNSRIKTKTWIQNIKQSIISLILFLFYLIESMIKFIILFSYFSNLTLVPIK